MSMLRICLDDFPVSFVSVLLFMFYLGWVIGSIVTEYRINKRSNQSNT